MWTRVKSRDMLHAKRMVVFDMDDDISKLKKTDEFKYESQNNGTPYLFDPDNFVKD